jgi:SdpC family antimicrobial peptide
MLVNTHRLASSPFVLTLVAALFSYGLVLPGLGARPKTPVETYSGEDLYRGILLAYGPVVERIPEIRDHIRPSFDGGNPRLLRAVELFQDQLIDALGARHPGFFDAFGAAMRSGDHLRIQETLLDAARITLETLRQSPSIKTVGRDLRDDPDRVKALLKSLRANPGLEGTTDAELMQAVEAVVSLSVADQEAGFDDPYTVDSSIVAVLVAVAAIVAAITVVAASSYAAVLNVAGAVNFYLAVVATTSTYVTSGPKLTPEGMSLLQEQLIDSIALTFGS